MMVSTQKHHEAPKFLHLASDVIENRKTKEVKTFGSGRIRKGCKCTELQVWCCGFARHLRQAGFRSFFKKVKKDTDFGQCCSRVYIQTCASSLK